MGFTRDTYLELDQYGSGREIPGHNHDRIYEASYFVSANERGFLHLSSPNIKDPAKNDYFAYETGMPGIAAEIRDGGTSTKERTINFQENYLANLKIQQDRLVPVTGVNPELADTFEKTVEKLLDLSPVATQAAKIHHTKPAPEPTSFG